MAAHKFLPKPPKRLAVVDQNSCSGCAGSPACVTYCETVTVREKVVDAIRTVDWPGSPFELAVVEYDKCIGCGDLRRGLSLGRHHDVQLRRRAEGRTRGDARLPRGAEGGGDRGRAARHRGSEPRS